MLPYRRLVPTDLRVFEPMFNVKHIAGSRSLIATAMDSPSDIGSTPNESFADEASLLMSVHDG